MEGLGLEPGLGLAVGSGGLEFVVETSSDATSLTAVTLLAASLVALEKAVDALAGEPTITASGPRFEAMVHCPPVWLTRVSRPGGPGGGSWADCLVHVDVNKNQVHNKKVVIMSAYSIFVEAGPSIVPQNEKVWF